MWFQRDQFTNSQLRLSDQQLIADQQVLHKQTHPHSQPFKNPKGCLPNNSLLIPGNVVYLYADKDSSRARSRYFVTKVDGEWCIIRKFAGSQLRNVHIMSNAMNAMLYPQTIICLIMIAMITTVITMIPNKKILYTSKIVLALITVIAQVLPSQ